MSSLLLPLPVLAIVLAALDAVLARWATPWRMGDVRLFFHAYFLWSLFGLLALGPAWLTLQLLDRRTRARPRRWLALEARSGDPRLWAPRGFDARPWVVLAGWMVLPVAVQAILDAHTTLVGFSGLAAARPWLEVAAVVAAGALALAGLGALLGRVPGVRTATAGVGLAFAAGLFLPATSASSVPPVRAAARPNLLLLVLDTCRADKLQAYGHPRPTSPGLAELAEESLVFEDSLSVATFTFTSHLSMLSGVLPETHGAHLLDMRYDRTRAESIAEILAREGYRTGAFVGTDVLAGRTGLRAGFEVYDDRVDPAVCDTFAWRLVRAFQSLGAEFVPALRFNGRPHWIQDFQRPADEVLARASAWIRADDPRPWFAFVNLYDVHWPYLPEGAGRELVRPYAGPMDGFVFRSDDWQPGYRPTEADKRHIADLYEGELYDLDALVARFLGDLGLERGGTAVLVTSDHGEGLGEGNTWNHDDVRECQVRVPLILRLPEAEPRGERVDAPVSGIDVAPTLLALAGVPVPADIEGRDLLALDRAEPRERWVDDRDHVRRADFRCALYRGDFKLVRFGAGADVRYELYDLAADPDGFADVSAHHPELLAELVARMEERSGASEPLSSGADSAASAAALQALGYAGD